MQHSPSGPAGAATKRLTRPPPQPGHIRTGERCEYQASLGSHFDLNHKRGSPPGAQHSHSAPCHQLVTWLWAGCSPRARTAFWATSASVSWESRDRASMAPSVGLLTFSSASARGIALLHAWTHVGEVLTPPYGLCTHGSRESGQEIRMLSTWLPTSESASTRGPALPR